MLGQAGVEAVAPDQAQFGIDVHHVDAGLDGAAEIVVVGAGAAVQREQRPSFFFYCGDALDIEMLFSFSFDHALHQAVHVADGRRENVDAGGGDEFFRFVGSGAEFGQVRRGCVDFGAGTDVADFAFDQNVGIDGFQFLHGVAGLAHVFVERQRGKIEDDGIEAGVRGFERFGQRMGVISVQVDRKIEFVAQAFHQRGHLAHAEKSAFAFRHADHDRHAQLARRREDAHENIIVANVEMPHGDFVFLRLLQNLA